MLGPLNSVEISFPIISIEEPIIEIGYAVPAVGWPPLENMEISLLDKTTSSLPLNWIPTIHTDTPSSSRVSFITIVLPSIKTFSEPITANAWMSG